MKRIIELALPTEVAYQKLAKRCESHIDTLALLPKNLSKKELEVLYDIQTFLVAKKYIEKYLATEYRNELFDYDPKKLQEFILGCHYHMEHTDPPHVVLRQQILSEHIKEMTLERMVSTYEVLLAKNEDTETEWMIPATFNDALIARLNDQLPLAYIKKIANLLYFPKDKVPAGYTEKIKSLLGELYESAV